MEIILGTCKPGHSLAVALNELVGQPAGGVFTVQSCLTSLINFICLLHVGVCVGYVGLYVCLLVYFLAVFSSALHCDTLHACMHL